MRLDWVLNARLALTVGATLRVLAAVVLLALPQHFPMRDYEVVAPADLTWGERALYRPRYAPIAEDETAYDALGRSIAAGDGFLLGSHWVIARAGEPTAYGGALYPMFVAAVYKVTGGLFPPVVALQLLLSIAAVYGVGRIGAFVGGRPTEALAAWGAALHPGLVMAPSLMMTEALSIPGAVAIVLAAKAWLDAPSVRRAALCGLLIGAAFLVRSPLGLMGLAVSGVALLVRWKRGAGETRSLLQQAAVALVTAAVVLAPWVARNQARYDRFVLSDTKSGVNLWAFNRPPEAPGWPNVDRLNEAERDAHFRQLARRNITRYPGWFTATTLSRALRYWWPVPRRAVNLVHWAGVAVYTLATLLAMLGLILLFRRLRRFGPEWLVVTGVAVSWGLSALTAVGLRHRLTGEPLLMVCAGLALATLLLVRRPALESE
jgi:hypothetical protein